MDQTLLLVMTVAMSVALLVWALLSILSDTSGEDKKQLQRRLSGESRAQTLEPNVAKAIRRDVALTGVSRYLISLPGMAKTHHALEQTWPKMSLAKFLMIAAGMAFVAFVLFGGMFLSLLLGCGGGIVAAALPFIFLNMRRNRRQQKLNDQLPDALDFLARILRSGHSLSTGLQMVGEELPEPLSAEFRRAYSSHSLGRSLDQALKETSLRVGSTDFGFFVTAVLIQRQTGGDLAEVLDNISEMIRGRLRLQQHVMAKTAEGRFTGYILTAFPVIMFFLTYALNPTYASVLLEGTGLYVLGAAAAMCIIGLLVIRKITQVKV